MLATIEKGENEYIVRMERNWNHSVEEVWSYLTDNEKLTKWFSELSVADLKKGGQILFDMGDGTFEKMKITDFHEKSVLEYEWGEDHVRFELSSSEKGCKLTFIETINMVTDHTPRDIAGWHVCLDAIEFLLEGKTMEFRMDEWKKWFEKYVELFNNIDKK